jgi:hypothetical protein
MYGEQTPREERESARERERARAREREMERKGEIERGARGGGGRETESERERQRERASEQERDVNKTDADKFADGWSFQVLPFNNNNNNNHFNNNEQKYHGTCSYTYKTTFLTPTCFRQVLSYAPTAAPLLRFASCCRWSSSETHLTRPLSLSWTLGAPKNVSMFRV